MQTKFKYLSILLGLFYCLFILWNRLLRNRKPFDLFTEYNVIRVCVYLCLCIGSFIIVVFFIRKLFVTPKNFLLRRLLEKPWLIRLITFVEEYVLNAPKNLYEVFYTQIPITDKMTKVGQFIYYQNFNERPYKIKLIIGILYGFQLFLCLIFIHNVFFLHKLTYFYKSLPLLLIPMLLRLLLFMQYDLSTKSIKNIEVFIKFIPKDCNTGWIMFRTDAYKENPNLTNAKMDAYASYWYMYIHSLMSIDHFHRLENKAKPYVYIFCYSLYALGWGYILYRIYLNDSGSDAFQWLWVIQDIENPFSLTNTNAYENL